MKKIISLIVLVMLVAIFSVTALAAEGGMTFGAAYDVQRFPAYPSTNDTSMKVWDLTTPHGASTTSGEWKLTYINTFGNVTDAAKEGVDDTAASLKTKYGLDENGKNALPVYQLFCGSESIGYVIPVVTLENGTKMFAIMDGSSVSGGYGYLFSKEAITDASKYTGDTEEDKLSLKIDRVVPDEPTNPEKVTVTFDANGGTIAEEAATKEVEVNAAVSELPAVTAPTGHKFKGWYTAATGGDKVTAETTVSAAVTYYAQWEKEDYNITYNAGEGKFEDGNNSKTISAQTWGYNTQNPGVPTRTGYTFEGWYTAENGTGDKIVLGEKWTIDLGDKGTTVTYYAKWTANEYTVVFDSNKPANASTDIEGEMDDQARAYDDGETLTANGYSLVGYKFKGWNTAADGNGTAHNEECTENLTTEDDATVTLYAVWEPNRYKIYYSTEVSSGSTEMKVDRDFTYIDFDAEITELADPERYGYNFAGWFDEDEVEVTEETEWEFDGNRTVHAHWEAKEYTLYFDANLFRVKDPAPRTIVFDEAIGRLPMISGAGYTFLGWYYEDGTKASAADVLVAESNVVLTAKWSKNPCNHKFDDNNKCTKCGVVIINHDDKPVEKPAEESNPNTGAPAPVSAVAAIAVLSAAAVCLGKRK